jgi:hypothetical protein
MILGIAGFGLAVLVAGAVAPCTKMSADSKCLAAGYTSSKVSWKLDAYCIKRVDQTDVVVPLGEAGKDTGGDAVERVNRFHTEPVSSSIVR